MTLTCSHGGVKVKMKCTLHIYIVLSVDWYHHWRNRSSTFGGEANTNCYPSKHLNSQNRSISRPWPAVMEGSRSKWTARCTSTLFPQLIGIIIGEIGRVVSEEKRTQTATRQTSKFPKSKYFATLTCSHGGVKVKMMCTLHIYTVPSVDWYHHWRNRSSSFGGEANTNYYPSAKIICDERTDTLITIWPPFGAIITYPVYKLSYLISRIYLNPTNDK